MLAFFRSILYDGLKLFLRNKSKNHLGSLNHPDAVLKFELRSSCFYGENKIWKACFNKVIVSAFNLLNHTKFYGVTLFGKNIHFLVYLVTHFFPRAHWQCIFLYCEQSWHLFSYTSHAFKRWTVLLFFLSTFAPLVFRGVCLTVFTKPAVTRELFDV